MIYNNTEGIAGTVLNIQHFCVDDGPGIRTTVFLKGCPLRCAWCHNPESQRREREYLFRADRCTGCGACAAVCTNQVHSFGGGIHSLDRSRCSLCGACIDIGCDALEIAGRRMSLEVVMQEIEADRVFYKRSGGGVTVSGGEPLSQAEFTLQLLRRCREEGIHTCVETCGYGSSEDLLRFAVYTDLFLYDCKLTEEERHKRYTGVSARPIQHNLRLLSDAGAQIILRCPMIPDVNLDADHCNSIAALANVHPGIRQIHLLPYHPMGLEKCASLDRKADYVRREFLEKSALEDIRCRICEKTDTPVFIL